VPVFNAHFLMNLLLLTIFLVFFAGCSVTEKITNINNSNSGNDPRIYQTTRYCEPLPSPGGSVINVSPRQAGALNSIVNNAPSGSVILLADGEYLLNGRQLRITTPGITIRSASGDPRSVILNGNYMSKAIITMAASNTTVAELTLKKAYTHPIHVIPSNIGDTRDSVIYRVHIEDPREQAIKINSVNGRYADNGIIACSRLTLTDAGRAQVSPAITGCYTGGIDAHDARGWTVRDNVIEGFWCNNGLSEHAIHFWTGSNGTVVKRNILKDNARGIGFGLLNRGKVRTYNDSSCPIAGTVYIGHYNGVIKNNFISASSPGLFNSKNGFDCGICLASACQTTVVHNTIVSTSRVFAAIDIRFAGSYEYKIYNNLLSHNILERGGSSGAVSHNIIDRDLSVFVDKVNADLHLTTKSTPAVDSGLKLKSGVADFDIDGQSRGSSPDVGADER